MASRAAQRRTARRLARKVRESIAKAKAAGVTVSPTYMGVPTAGIAPAPTGVAPTPTAPAKVEIIGKREIIPIVSKKPLVPAGIEIIGGKRVITRVYKPEQIVRVGVPRRGRMVEPYTAAEAEEALEKKMSPSFKALYEKAVYEPYVYPKPTPYYVTMRSVLGMTPEARKAYEVAVTEEWKPTRKEKITRLATVGVGLGMKAVDPWEVFRIRRKELGAAEEEARKLEVEAYRYEKEARAFPKMVEMGIIPSEFVEKKWKALETKRYKLIAKGKEVEKEFKELKTPYLKAEEKVAGLPPFKYMPKITPKVEKVIEKITIGKRMITGAPSYLFFPKEFKKGKEFETGFYKGFYEEFRTKPIKSAALFGVPFAIRAAAPAVGFGLRKLPLLAKAAKPVSIGVKYGIPGLYAGTVGYGMYKAPTMREKGIFLGRRATEIGALVAGAYAIQKVKRPLTWLRTIGAPTAAKVHLMPKAVLRGKQPFQIAPKPKHLRLFKKGEYGVALRKLGTRYQPRKWWQKKWEVIPTEKLPSPIYIYHTGVRMQVGLGRIKTTVPGAGEVPVAYGAPSIHPKRFEIAMGIKRPSRFYGGDVFPKDVFLPRALTFVTRRGRIQLVPPTVKGKIAPTATWLPAKGKRGIWYVLGLKTEVEAGLIPKTLVKPTPGPRLRLIYKKWRIPMLGKEVVTGKLPTPTGKYPTYGKLTEEMAKPYYTVSPISLIPTYGVSALLKPTKPYKYKPYRPTRYYPYKPSKVFAPYKPYKPYKYFMPSPPPPPPYKYKPYKPYEPFVPLPPYHPKKERVFVPPPEIIPSKPFFPAFRRKKGYPQLGLQPLAYQPSLGAIILDVWAKRPPKTTITGLTIRPMIKRRKTRRRRKR